MPYRLSLLGPWDLHGPDGEHVRSVLAQPKRLCLLAYLALSGEPVSRSTIVSVFWPESDEERARNALSQSLHYLRRSLSGDAVTSVAGDRLQVSPDHVWFDARALLESESAESGDDGVSALAERVLDGHEFFEGWNAEDSQPLQDWLDEVRRRTRERAAEVAAEVGAEADAGVAEEAGEEVEPGGAARPGEAGGVSGAEGEGAAAGGSAAAGDHAGRPAADAKTTPFAEPLFRIRKIMWVVGGVAVGIVLALATFRGGGEAPATARAPSGAEAVQLAVLLPRVTVLGADPPFSPRALAHAVHEEVLARLGLLDGPEIISLPFESEVAQLVRSLEAQGTVDRPGWVVSISVRSGDGQARVIALLLRGPDYTEARAVSAGDYPVPDGSEALLDLPRRIAAEVGAEFERVVEGR